jgi:hypothetical protein
MLQQGTHSCGGASSATSGPDTMATSQEPTGAGSDNQDNPTVAPPTRSQIGNSENVPIIYGTKKGR